MDEDKSFQAKRKALVFVSLLLLALVVSGAQIKEANTFIFKIEFANHEGLNYLLVAAVVVCVLRYYAYSEKYNNHLFAIWSGRLLCDYLVYRIDPEDGLTSGLAGRKASIHVGDKYDTDNPVYKKTGFFKRSIGFRTSEIHEHYGEVYFTKYFKLNEYTGQWCRRDFLRLLWIEFKYRTQALFKYRETLDLWSPYLLAICSLLAFVLSLAMHKPLEEKPVKLHEVKVEVVSGR